jgi:iron only hydrogenase large subunit-like protein
MEAALRTAADWLAKKDLKQIDYKTIRGMKTTKESEISIGKEKIRICVVHTLGEARKIMEQIKSGNCQYHFIEIMACYGGCIGGGGQPLPCSTENLAKRTNALIKEDLRKKLRKSHKNPAVLQIYKEYLGEFGGKRAHELLHTHYRKRESI